MVNLVVLMGRLTADPELVTSSSGATYTRFTVAVDRSFVKSGEERETDFIRCVAWGKTAEFICNYFGKGQMISVQGEIRTGSYTNRDGAKVFTTDINVDKVSFTGDKRERGSSGSENSYASANRSASSSRSSSRSSERSEERSSVSYSSGSSDDFEADDVFDSDLPF